MRRQGTRPYLPDSTTRRPEVVRQYGYLRPDGVQVWFDRDHHGNGVSTQSQAVEAIERFQAAYAQRVGVTVPVELIYEDYITTRWSRWAGPRRTGRFIAGKEANRG